MTTSSLKYTVNLEDLIAFSEDYQRHSESFRRNLRKRQLAWLGGFLIAGFLFALLGLQNDSNSSANFLTSAVVSLLCAAPGILIFALLPRLAYRSIRSRVKKIFAKGKNHIFLGDQELRLDADTLTVRNDFYESKYSWATIEKIISTTNHIYVFNSAVTAIVIPKHAVFEGDWQEIENLIKEKINTA